MLLGAPAVAFMAAIAVINAQSSNTTWQMAGNDLTNSRNQTSEHTIQRSNVSTLTPNRFGRRLRAGLGR
jgi:hypothetical protein